MKRRTLIHSIGAGIGLGTVGTVTAEHQENYAEITFNDQQTGGAVVRVARTFLEHDGFITIHARDLLNPPEGNGDGPGTIVGVSRPLEPGEHFDEAVRLFHHRTGYSQEFGNQKRLKESQSLIAVPHRDMNHTGEFEFTGEHHTDVPFTNGPETREDLPVPGAVNDVAEVTVGRPDERRGPK